MKTLWLLRHAKSSSVTGKVDDIHRPLAPRGRDASARIGRYLAERGADPQLVLCSTAVRARETWCRVAAAAELACPIDYRQDLYLAGADQIWRAIRSVAASVDRVLTVGHNPGFEDLSVRLGGAVAARPGAKRFPTGALATFEFDGDRWRDLDLRSARLAGYVKPKDL